MVYDETRTTERRRGWEKGVKKKMVEKQGRSSAAEEASF